MDFGEGRQYGNAEIGGHASVHQGDAHTNTALNIYPGNTINISVQGNIEWPSVARKRLLETDHPARPLCTTKRKRLQDGAYCEGRDIPNKVHPRGLLENALQDRSHAESSDAQDAGLREQGVHLVNQILEASGSKEKVSSSSHKHTDLHQTRAIQHLRSTLRGGAQTRRNALLNLIDQVRQNSLFPAVAKVFANPPASIRQEAFQEATVLSSSFEVVTPTRGYGSAQDLVAVFLAMLTMLSCRQAGHGNQNVPQASSSSKVSLIAGLVTFAFARYLCLPLMLRQISEWAGGSLIIQDPFMHELRVPKAHAEHFILLEAFLRLKLSDTTAEVFIEAGQFNLTLGQRYGRALSKTDWSVKGFVGSNSRVVMSVYLKKQDATCVECQEQLIMSESGQFAW